MSVEKRATAFESRRCSRNDHEVVVYTDESDPDENEVAIVVPRYRLRALVQACLDALEGESNVY